MMHGTRTLLCRLLIPAVLLAFCSSPVRAERHALVIGNSAYAGVNDLRGRPVNDARDIAQALELVGFRGRVTLLTDVDKRRFKDAVKAFGTRLGPDDEAVFYYSGHGVQFRDRNFLLPVGAIRDITVPDHLEDEAVSLRYVLAVMGGSRVSIAIVDACRDNPFKGLFKGSASAGLASEGGPDGTVVAYATEGGREALAGSGRNSPYVEALKAELVRPGLDIFEMLTRVRGEVVTRTGNEQRPEFHSRLNGRFCFAGCERPEDPEKERLRRELAALQAQLQAGAGSPPDTTPAPARRAASSTPRHGDRFTDSVLGQEFVYLQGDCFQMGSPDDEKDRGSDERQHRVCVDSLWLATTEVTNAQFRRFRPGHDSGAYGGHSLNGDRQPVVEVSWEDAMAFVAWLNAQHAARGDGKRYALPSEAQWEYAARAGTDTARFWGDDPSGACLYENVADQTAQRQWSAWIIHDCDDGQAVTAAVGSYRANPWGLQDMLGNVLEWTCSLYQTSYDGTAEKACASDSKPGSRVLRGGSWFDFPGWVRSAGRGLRAPSYRSGGLGFRLARIS